jgi:hypothetical protein
MKKFVLNVPVFFAVFIWTLLPAVIFCSQLLQQYSRETGGFTYDPVAFSQIVAWLEEPEFVILSKLALNRVGLTVAIGCVSALIALMMIAFMRDEKVRLAASFSVIGFFVPPIIKAYAWETTFRNNPLWDNFGILAYGVSAFFGFYLAMMLLKVQGTSLSALRGLREFYHSYRLLWELAQMSVWPIIFAALCTFSLLFFSGDELRRFGPNITVFGDVLASINPGRRIASLVSVVCILANFVVATITYLVLTNVLRPRFR